ncbi:MAG: hypothetical protein H0W08_00010 [Acidobacteria bacterium]|nr:hypothetical protein [Acidobacteriota bacterium]
MNDVAGEVTNLRPGLAVDIPLGCAFQFTSNGVGSLDILIFTFPAWPGATEALPVPGARRWGA